MQFLEFGSRERKDLGPIKALGPDKLMVDGFAPC